MPGKSFTRESSASTKNLKNLFGEQREDNLTSLEACYLLWWKQIVAYYSAVFPGVWSAQHPNAGRNIQHFPLVSKAIFKLSDSSPLLGGVCATLQSNSHQLNRHVSKEIMPLPAMPAWLVSHAIPKSRSLGFAQATKYYVHLKH